MAANFEWPWERAAMHGDEMPEDLSLPDQAAFTAMRNIYSAYRDKKLNREQASREKKLIRYQYESDKQSFEFTSSWAQRYAALMRDSELARTACRKNPTSENALLLCDVLDGLFRGEVSKSVSVRD